MIDPGTLDEWGEMTRHPVAENPDDWKGKPDDTAEDRELNERIHREFTEVRDGVTSEPDRQLTWPELHELSARLSERVAEYCGIPIPVPGMRLRLAPDHPLGGLIDTDEYAGSAGRICTTDDVDDGTVIRNRWFSYKKNVEVWLVVRAGKIEKLVVPVSPDRSMDRLTFWLNTLGASVAWSMEAELKAREKLRSLIPAHAYQHYELTGCFLESSKRSRVMYLFRRLRPTIAMVPRTRDGTEADSMKVLAVLCMHPIGYYEGSWAGAMCPTDDVLAHLLFMRGDEAMYWRKANQHAAVSAEAGL